VDYNTLDRPTAMRRQAAPRPEMQAQPMYGKVVGGEPDMDFLDIPAFLRKQAD
jgi:hypothetical protein